MKPCLIEDALSNAGGMESMPVKLQCTLYECTEQRKKMYEAMQRFVKHAELQTLSDAGMVQGALIEFKALIKEIGA